MQSRFRDLPESVCLVEMEELRADSHFRIKEMWTKVAPMRGVDENKDHQCSSILNLQDSVSVVPSRSQKK